MSFQRSRWNAELVLLGKEQQEVWLIEFTKVMFQQSGTCAWQFMGQIVCRAAWSTLAGVGSYRLQRLLQTVQNGVAPPADMRHHSMPDMQSEAHDALDQHLYVGCGRTLARPSQRAKTLRAPWRRRAVRPRLSQLINHLPCWSGWCTQTIRRRKQPVASRPSCRHDILRNRH